MIRRMPTAWPAQLARPADGALQRWFERIARRLLFGCRLVASGVPLRIIETEAYYHGPGHEDPFAHRDPVQLTPGRWYFHRTGGQYRGGSFKGLDLSFGDRASNAYGGMLIRGVEGPDRTVVDGPSLTVDRLLELTGHASVKALDGAMGEQTAWQFGLPLKLVDEPTTGPATWVTGPRVGLSLRKRRYTPNDPAFPFLFRPYRFLSEPRRTAKGKPHLVLPQIAAGVRAEEVTALTGCPTATVERYAAAFAAGRLLTDPSTFYGRELTTSDLCRLYGLWWERHGAR